MAKTALNPASLRSNSLILDPPGQPICRRPDVPRPSITDQAGRKDCPCDLKSPIRMDNSVTKEGPDVAHDVPIGSSQISLAQLNERSREIFRQIVESYLTTGEPLGSRNLSRLITTPLSPASVRNVMADLEQLGLIFAPHTSAGRRPTELGLRFFVDALMQIGDMSEADRRSIEAQFAAAGQAKSMETLLTEASALLSGLTRSAGIVLAAKTNQRLK